MNRKSFLHTTTRLLLLGAFAGGTVHLVRKEQITEPGTCDKSDQCKGCGSFINCSLPQAFNQRNHG